MHSYAKMFVKISCIHFNIYFKCEDAHAKLLYRDLDLVIKYTIANLLYFGGEDRTILISAIRTRS